MIISRRKYERDLKEAYEKGVRETEERVYQNEEFRRLHERINEMGRDIQELKGSDCCNEQTAKRLR